MLTMLGQNGILTLSVMPFVLVRRKEKESMSEKRRDLKGRILNNGEYQETSGKFKGRYSYKYKDKFGKRKTVYSWRLTKADPFIEGKKKTKSLREMIVEIDGLVSEGIANNDITVIELVDQYLSTKATNKHNTSANYNFVRNILLKEDFSHKKIDNIKTSDCKAFLVKMQKEDGRGASTIKTVRGVLRPAFQMAVNDDMLKKNPFGFELHEVLVDDSVKREAITRDQERKFLEFVKNDTHFCKYYEGIYILFKTGLRISEFVGLTVSDIDFDNHNLEITHQLQRTRSMQYVIESTKTKCGTRTIPMTEDVEECFRKIIENRPSIKVEPMIDGYSGFLYFDKNDKPMVALHWEKYFQHICEKYNKIYKIQMPKVTPHVCRHTFCSNMTKSGMNPKALQYIMGHSDISVTLNTYTHIKAEEAREEMERIKKEQKKSVAVGRKIVKIS